MLSGNHITKGGARICPKGARFPDKGAIKQNRGIFQSMRTHFFVKNCLRGVKFFPDGKGTDLKY